MVNLCVNCVIKGPTFEGSDFSTSFLTRLSRKGSNCLCKLEKPVFSDCLLPDSNSDQSSNLRIQITNSFY